jgi:RHS repeat-associated protein
MYLPFGGTRWESGSTPTDFQFTGQRKEAGFGLYDYHARFYDPLIGRFISADSIVPQATNPQALNRYSYVVNNPLKYTDPTGHCFLVCAIVGVAAGALYGYGSQVINNLNNGKDWETALTTNIDVSYVAFTAGAGALIGGTAGLILAPVVYGASSVLGTATTAACADGDCTNEVQQTTQVIKQTTDVFSRITPTQDPIAGQVIPKSFEIATESSRFWVHPNATKHMYEFLSRNPAGVANPAGAQKMSSQVMLESFEQAVKLATEQGIRYGEKIRVGNWELIFDKARDSGLLDVIKHAVYFPD